MARHQRQPGGVTMNALSIDVDRGRATEVVGVLSRRCTLGEHRRRAPAFSLLSR